MLRFKAFIIALVSGLLLSSCYSAVLTSTHGIPRPTMSETEKEYWKDKYVVQFDTVLKAPIGTDQNLIKTRRDGCPSGKLYQVELKNSFGGVLLYLVTFGTRRKFTVKYVCMQEQ